jgi:hypothetical protein
MNIASIVSAIDQEIARLTTARKLLTGSSSGSVDGIVTKRRPGRPKAAVAAPKKRTFSPEGRARIAAAQKRRWAKVKRG